MTKHPREVETVKHPSPAEAVTDLAPEVTVKAGAGEKPMKDYAPQIVLVGAVDTEQGRLAMTETVSSTWSRGDRRYGEPFPKVAAGTIFEVDVVNCAGYLARAKASMKDTWNWRLELIPGSVAPDAVQKIKDCGGREAFNEFTGFAFAVYPSVTERRNFKMQAKPDLKKLYESLPSELKQWLKAAEKQIGDERPQAKETLDPDNDMWADLNGDGEVDLIEVHGKCNGTAEDDLTCGRIWYLSNGEWQEIAFITPA